MEGCAKLLGMIFEVCTFVEVCEFIETGLENQKNRGNSAKIFVAFELNVFQI